MSILIIPMLTKPAMSEAQRSPSTGATLYERGKDYEIWKINDQQLKLVSGTDAWVFDKTLQKYVPHVIDIIDNSNVNVQSGLVGMKIGPQLTVITNSDMNETRAKESWIVTNHGKEIKAQFVKQAVIEVKDGVLVSNYYDLPELRGFFEIASPQMQILYKIMDGKLATKIITITGTQVNGIQLERRLSDVTGEKIYVDGKSARLDSSGIFVMSGSEEMMMIMKGQDVAFYERLGQSHPYIRNISFANNTISLFYDGWSGDKLELTDPTFTSSTPTDDNWIETNVAAGATCPSTSYTKNNSTIIRAEADATAGGTCGRGYFQWNISTLLTGSTVSSTVIQFDVSSVSNAVNCDYKAMTSHKPSTTAASTLWSDIGSGTAYVSNDSTCTTTGTNKSVTLGSTANTDVQNQIASGWFAVGLKFNNETRLSGAHKIVQLKDQSDGTATPAPTLVITYTPPLVTIPVVINARTGSDTMETAGVAATISGNGCTGTLTHDGNPASQNFSCWAASTITLTVPTDTGTSRFRFGTGSTSAQWTSCNSGTCSNQQFDNFTRQLAVTVTLSGLDASRSVSVTRTQVGTSGTQSVSGATATTVWADQRTNVITPSSAIVITSNQERFKTYNSTSTFTYNATATASKTYVFQHEFNQLFRIHETHLGDIFSPMPASVYTGSVTTANGTAISGLTFNVQNTDDYEEVSSRYWIKNGTQTFSNPTWRGIIANTTGTCSVTSYGNCDINSAVKHYGILPGQYHFRYGVDSGTTSTLTFSSLNAQLNFNGTSTAGTHSVVVEYLPSLYSGVQSITVNGASIPMANYTITSDNTLSPPVSVLTINNVHFSTDSFVIVLQAAQTSSPSPSTGGGGGGGSSSSGGSNTVINNPSPGSSLGLDVTVPTFYVSPGKTSDPQMITIQWQGSTKIIINDIHFNKNPQWFSVGETLPVVATMSSADGSTTRQIPLRVSVPADVTGTTETVDMSVTAITGSSQATKVVPVTVTYAGSSDLALYAFVGVVVLGIGAYAVKHRR